MSVSLVACQLPAFTIPQQLQPALDTDQYTPSPSYGTPDAVKLPSNETRACLQSSRPPMTSAPSDTNQVTATFGLSFDNLLFADYAQLELFAPPRFCVNDTFLTYKVNVKTPIYIEVCSLSISCFASQWIVSFLSQWNLSINTYVTVSTFWSVRLTDVTHPIPLFKNSYWHHPLSKIITFGDRNRCAAIQVCGKNLLVNQSEIFGCILGCWWNIQNWLKYFGCFNNIRSVG